MIVSVFIACSHWTSALAVSLSDQQALSMRQAGQRETSRETAATSLQHHHGGQTEGIRGSIGMLASDVGLQRQGDADTARDNHANRAQRVRSGAVTARTNLESMRARRERIMRARSERSRTAAEARPREEGMCCTTCMIVHMFLCNRSILCYVMYWT